MAPRRVNIRKNVNENVDREAPEATVYLLAEQVTNAEFRGAFQVLDEDMMAQSNRDDFVPMNKKVDTTISRGQNVRVRLPGTTLRVLEEDPNPWPNKLPRQLEVVHGGSGSVSRTCSTNGQKVALHHRDTANSIVSENNLQNFHGTPPRRELSSRRNLRK
uniref:Integrase core domain containing protein n=1 Tax=Solanum tuberosum TaxID=4113 RepID=M1DDC0_SOLTU